MLAYAAHRRQVARPRPAPHAMLGIMVAHIAIIAAVMSARMDLPSRIFEPPTVIDPIPLPKPPPPPPQPRTPESPQRAPSVIEQPTVIVPIPQPAVDAFDSAPSTADSGDVVGPNLDPPARPAVAPVRIGPRFATPAGLIRPPYPASKLAAEEEAQLRLRLSIDASGRVTGVEPIGDADRAFLEAARRHILARWQYKPASEDGRPVASSTVITLRFELD